VSEGWAGSGRAGGPEVDGPYVSLMGRRERRDAACVAAYGRNCYVCPALSWKITCLSVRSLVGNSRRSSVAPLRRYWVGV